MTAPATASRPSKQVTLRLLSGGKTGVEIPSDWTVDHATKEIVREFELPEKDPDNNQQHYELFRRQPYGPSERLRPSSTIGEVIEDHDEIEPMPEIVPGVTRER